MNFIDTSLIIVAFLNIPLIFLVYFKNPKNISNIFFTFFIIAASLWPISIALFRLSNDLGTAWFWNRIIYSSGTLAAAGFLFFSLSFTKRSIKNILLKLLSFLIPSIFIFLLIFTNLIIQEITFISSEKIVKIGPAYLVWMSYFGLAMGIGSWALYKEYYKSTGLLKAQIRYILLAIFFPVIGAFPPNILLPLFGIYKFIFIGPFFIFAMTLLISYAIIRHRLFDFRFAITGIISYSITILLSFIFFVITTIIYSFITNTVIQPSVYILMLIVSLVFTTIFGQFRNLSKFITSRYLFQSVYDYQKTLISLSKSLSTYLEMPKLVDLIINTLMQTMRLDRVAVLVKDPDDIHYRIQKTIGFNEDNGISLVKDNFLTSYLEKNPQVIVLDEIKRLRQESHYQFEKEGFREIADNMKRIEAALIVPIINADKLISLIVLGNKISGDSYTVQDINLLTTIASQASIAIENARLYKEIQEFNKGLKIKVDEATVEIQKRSKQLEEANIQIGLASKVKNDLLTMASHEFRTPISIINNALWFLNKDEVKTKLSEKEHQNLERVVQTMERLNYVVNNINQMLLTTGGDLELELAPAQMEIIIKEVIEDKKNEAFEKQIKVQYLESQKLLPDIIADKIKLKYVFWELITNALKYTDHGGSITIQTNHKDENLEIKITDTGRGIPERDLSTIFEGFKKLDVFHTTQPGMGLGLYIIKKIIDLHAGRIKVESIEGKGTTFIISLPIKNIPDIQVNNTPINKSQNDSADPPINQSTSPLQLIKCLMAFQLFV